jgi:hypothetical protein
MKKIIISSVILLGMSIMITSCLKDKTYDDGKTGTQSVENGPKIIEISQAANNPNPVVFALNTSPSSEDIVAFDVNLATGYTAPEDLKVNIVKNMTIVSDYNTANSTTYEELPLNCYTLPASALVITIPKGSNKGYLNLKLNKNNFDFSKNYALGYTMASLPTGYTISQNFRNVMITVGLKNKYDGAYILNGFHNRPPYDFPMVNEPMELHTSGSASVKFYWPAVGGYGHPIGTGVGALGWYGASVGPSFTADPLTNSIVSATNVGAAAPPIDLDPSVATHRVTWNTTTNKPDKVYITWRYNANQARRFFDTLTYVGPR